MKRREFLKSTVLVGTGLGASAKVVLAADSSARVPAASGNSEFTMFAKRRTLGSGRAALTVSALSFGCMGMQTGRGLTPDEKSMEKLIRQAYERGCDFFDTAEGYASGRNEELLGRAVASIRDKISLAPSSLSISPRIRQLTTIARNGSKQLVRHPFGV